MPLNPQILLDNRPVGEAMASNFKLVSSETPPLQDGQVLVRHHFLSLDPYMRGRMNEGKSYAAAQALGEVMLGGTAGEVVQSQHAKFAVGDKVVGMGGWQEYSLVNADEPGALHKVDTTHIPLSAYLGAVGMPGVTAAGTAAGPAPAAEPHGRSARRVPVREQRGRTPCARVPAAPARPRCARRR